MFHKYLLKIIFADITVPVYLTYKIIIIYKFINIDYFEF